MLKKVIDSITRYAIRRAYYRGIVVRKDLMSAFGLREATATRVMGNLEVWSEVTVESANAKRRAKTLLRRERDLVPIPGSRVPAGHDGRQIFKELLTARPGHGRLGFDVVSNGSEEGALELHMWRFRALDLPKDVDYTTLLKGLIWKTPVSIEYVGMKVADSARWRTILPLALHVIEGQMVVHAYDLGLSEPAIRAYVIYRIQGVKPVLADAGMRRQVRRLLEMSPGREAQKTYQITLNPKLTKDQVNAVRRELGLNEQLRLQIYPTLEYHLRRFYMSSHEDRQGPDIVWPIIERIEEVT